MRKEDPCCTAWKDRQFTWVVKLVDTPDLGSIAERRESSSLSLSTQKRLIGRSTSSEQGAGPANSQECNEARCRVP